MTARLSVRGKLDRPWAVPCTCGDRYAEHTDGSGCRVCACSRYRSIEAEATAAAEQRLRERIEALIEERGGLCVASSWEGIPNAICATHSELLFDGFCEDDPRDLRAVLARLSTDPAEPVAPDKEGNG